MIDFKNGSVIKLKEATGSNHKREVSPLLISGEEIVNEYQAIRDYVIFTNKRIIAVNVQGITGTKKDYTSLPYSKIQLFSVETAGVFDLDGELDLYFSGAGKIRFEFSGNCDIAQIGRVIGQYVL